MSKKTLRTWVHVTNAQLEGLIQALLALQRDEINQVRIQRPDELECDIVIVKEDN